MDRAANTSANIDDNIEPWRLAKYRTDKVHSCHWGLFDNDQPFFFYIIYIYRFFFTWPSHRSNLAMVTPAPPEASRGAGALAIELERCNVAVTSVDASRRSDVHVRLVRCSSACVLTSAVLERKGLPSRGHRRKRVRVLTPERRPGL